MGLVTVSDLTRWLDAFAPRELAESWDNVGLLMGDPGDPLRKVMTCLTITAESASEAIDEGVGMIVSHHPLMFKPIQSLRADHPSSRLLWQLARSGIAVYSPHTSFDNCVGGINDGLAARLGLLDVGPLRPSYRPANCKVSVSAPEADRSRVLEAAFGAGAGRIGLYEACSFTTAGTGTFRGVQGSNPTLGQAGRFEVVSEARIELICPNERIAAVVAAIRTAHSYEEPAIDVVSLAPLPSGPGIGRLGRLAKPVTLHKFAGLVARILNAPSTQFVGDSSQTIEKVAICCGAGDDFLTDASQVGADVLLTGEARFHRALEAEDLGIGLVVAGHYATERPGVEDLAARLQSDFPNLLIFPSQRECDPLSMATQETM